MKNLLSILLVSIILMGCVPRDGLKRWWYINGQLMYEVNYKDGKKDGLWRFWDENGKLKWEQKYKDGKEDGLWRWWL